MDPPPANPISPSSKSTRLSLVSDSRDGGSSAVETWAKPPPKGAVEALFETFCLPIIRMFHMGIAWYN